jgi:hypothetical protein
MIFERDRVLAEASSAVAMPPAIETPSTRARPRAADISLVVSVFMIFSVVDDAWLRRCPERRDREHAPL